MNPLGRIVRSPWLWTFLLGVLVLTALRPLLMRVPAPPPVVASVPAFALVDSEGKPFGVEGLRGKATLVSFFFTRCRSICPVLMHSVKRLQAEILARGETRIRLLSITVDPEFDTPERLRAYGEELGVDPKLWVLATGNPDDVRRLAVEGFKVPAGEAAPAAGPAGLMDIAHTGKLVLVDPRGAIRGYYDTDSLGLDEALSRARQVAREVR